MLGLVRSLVFTLRRVLMMFPDIAAISISQAENRYMEMAPSQRFDAEFHAFDCFSVSRLLFSPTPTNIII